MNESGVGKLVGALTLFVCENFGRGERPPSSASVPKLLFCCCFFLTPLVYLCVKGWNIRNPRRILMQFSLCARAGADSENKMTLPVSGI